VCYYVDKLWKHDAKWKEPGTKGQYAVWFHLHVISRISRTTEIHVDSWLPRAGRKENQWLIMDMESHRGNNKMPQNCDKGYTYL
jgi:hypothetical protein